MSTKILFLEDLTSISLKNFRLELLKSLELNNYDVISIDLYEHTKDFMKNSGLNYSYEDEQFKLYYYSNLYSILNMIKEYTNARSNICFILTGIPNFNYTYKEYESLEYTFKNIFETFKDLFLYKTTIVNINSYLELVEGDVKNKTSFAKDYYDYCIKNNINLIEKIQKNKEIILKLIAEFRKNSVKCLTYDVNFQTDIQEAVKKIIELL